MNISNRLHKLIDRKLGYFGHSRFVLFYYEPRGEEVMWNDGRSYGFGFGGWRTFQDEIEPLALTHGLNLIPGDRFSGHVVLVDRVANGAYLADRQQAESLVQRQHDASPVQ